MKGNTRAVLVTLLTGALAGAPATLHAEYRAGLYAYDIFDYEVARFSWIECAERGDFRCQYALGTLYKDGKGVERDLRTAREWLLKAARQGSRDAQLELGILRSIGGEGVTQDVVRAYVWFTLAAREDDEEAVERRNLVEQMLSEEEKKEAQTRIEAWTD